MEAITLINNYKQLFNTAEKRVKNADLIKSLFSNSKQIKFNDLDFPENQSDYQFHLGYDGVDLYGILIKSNKNVFFGNTITSKTIVSKFEKMDYIVPSNLITKLHINNEITYDEVIKRKNIYTNNLNTLIDNSLKADKMVQYFCVNNENFELTGNNTCILTAVFDEQLGGDVRFDLITINTSYKDIVRPVPPFKPFVWASMS